MRCRRRSSCSFNPDRISKSRGRASAKPALSSDILQAAPGVEGAAISTPQITVLDTGGQYTHLIARRIRELGVYADVQPSDTPVATLRSRKGLIISGGPASVLEPGCPDIDPQILTAGLPVLGI